MHLCRFDHQSDLRNVAGICYGRGPGVVPKLRGPRSIQEGVNTVVEPPSSFMISGTVTTVSVIVSVHGTERHTVQIGARVAIVNHTVS